MADRTEENDQRPPVYREGDFWVVRASSFGSCDLALARHAAGMQGADVPQTMKDAFAFGIENEKHVIRRLPEPDLGEKDWHALDRDDVMAGGWGEIDDSGQLALELTVGKVKVRCHPDGIAQNKQIRAFGGDLRVLEVKCMAEGNDPAKGMYDWQFGIEMAVTKLPLLLAIGWKKIDAESGQRVVDRIEVREIDEAPKTVVEIKQRAMKLGKLFDLAADGDWDAVGTCDQSMYPCPFYELHASDDPTYQEIVDDEKVAKIKDLGARIEELKEEERKGKVAADTRRLLETELAGVVGWGWKGYAGGWKVSATMTEVAESTRVVKAHTRKTVKIERKG